MSAATIPGGTHSAGKSIAPLRRVEHVAVSATSGEDLNPHYFWLTWEYSLWLECGHVQVRARCVFKRDPAPEKLQPPLPRRVRCAECPPVTSKGRARSRRPDPTFDPVMGNLVAALCQTVPAQRDSLLDWLNRHGRYVPDAQRRDRAYGAVALAVIDTYLPDTRNPHAPAVRDAVQRWTTDPGAEQRTQVRRATRRLYDSQDRDGDWFAHRGVIDAAKICSPHPHNIEGALCSPTWDNKTRSEFFNKLWSIRHEVDLNREGETGAVLDDNPVMVQIYSQVAESLGEKLRAVSDAEQPVLGEQHLALAISMLSAYQESVDVSTEGQQ